LMVGLSPPESWESKLRLARYVGLPI
jgi:hypothetical protein